MRVQAGLSFLCRRRRAEALTLGERFETVLGVAAAMLAEALGTAKGKPVYHALSLILLVLDPHYFLDVFRNFKLLKLGKVRFHNFLVNFDLLLLATLTALPWLLSNHLVELSLL